MHPAGMHLEAGCGAGYWVAVLNQRGLRVEGIEYAHNLVELVNSINPQLPVRQGDALSIDRPNNYYDTYRLLCGYLAYLDQTLKPRQHSE